MKFFIAEGNLGSGTDRAKVDRLITWLKQRGWDVEYGAAANKATDISEFGREQAITEKFTDDFMAGLADLEPSQE